LNLNSIFFISLVVLASAGITTVLLVGWESVTEDEFVDWRLDQLRQKQIMDEQLLPEPQFGGIVVSDYFRVKGDEYIYLGGLPGTPWIPGEGYQQDDIRKLLLELTREEEEVFYALRLGKNNLYINLDQGGGNLTKKYLHTLDQYQVSGFDTLFIDFRFMRQYDFAQLIALFNQLSPQEKIFLGTIINPYQEVELETSGQPFFYANQYVLMAHENLSDPLKGLIGIFEAREGYQIRGTYDLSQDTVCVYAGYDIGGKLYRICADQFVPAQYVSVKQEVISPMEVGEWQENFLMMEKNWYGVRDTAFIDKHLSLWLRK